MATYRVQLLIDFPDEAPRDDVERYIRFELGETHRLERVHQSIDERDLHSCNVRDIVIYEA